jgi:protease-4
MLHEQGYEVIGITMKTWDYAASGGYYMAMACDTIVAQPTTLTVSIGIFGVMFNVEKLMNEKLGVTFDGVNSHKYANFPSATRTMTDAEKNMIQNGVNKGYESFTTKAAKGRHMSIEKLKSLASGRVWTGSQAKANGLVDVIGGVGDAIRIAAQKAKLKDGGGGQFNFLKEKVMSLEENSEDEDYEAAATKRV